MLTIDIRERRVIDAIKPMLLLADMHISIETLPVGDMLVGDTFVIERKTIADLNSSLRDGRFKDQRSRLESISRDRKIIYILERDTGDILTRQATGALVSLVERGFSILPSTGVFETAEILVSILRRTSKKNIQIPQMNIVGDKKLMRSANTSPGSCAISQLCQIPGISRGFADRLCASFPGEGIVPIAEAIRRRDPCITSVIGKGKRLDKAIDFLYGTRRIPDPEFPPGALDGTDMP